MNSNFAGNSSQQLGQSFVQNSAQVNYPPNLDQQSASFSKPPSFSYRDMCSAP